MIKVRILTEDSEILGEYQLKERGDIDDKMEKIASWIHGAMAMQAHMDTKMAMQ
jgi:hypothetical protein